MKKSKKQSNLKVLATTSALIGVCCVGSGLNAETASASTTRIPTINTSTSTQANSSSLGTRLWNGIKRPFTSAGKLLGSAWNSLKSCFGFKSTNSNIQDIEIQPVSNENKSKTLKRGAKPTYSSSNKSNSRSTDNVEEILDNNDPIYTRVKKYNPNSKGSSDTTKQPKDVTYAALDFDNSNSTSGVRPRTQPETIYTKVKTGGSSNTTKQPKDVTYAALDFDNSNSASGVRPRTQPETIYTKVKTGDSSTKPNQIIVTADVHTPSSGTTPPPLPPKSSAQKTGTDNKGFDGDGSPTPKLRTFYQGYTPSTSSIDNLGFSGDDGSTASGGTRSFTKPKTMSSPPPLPPKSSAQQKSSIASGGASSSGKQKRVSFSPDINIIEVESNGDGASSSKKQKLMSSLLSIFNKSSNSSTEKTGVDNKVFDEDNNPTTGQSFYQDFLVLSDEGGTGSSKKPQRLFLLPQFNTDKNGANQKEDPIYQPIGNFTSTSQPQTQTSSTNSGGGNKPPVPAPRTKLQTKQ